MGPQVKGLAFRSALRALEQLRGPTAVQNTLSATSTDLARAVRYGTLIASSFYPIEWYRDLFSAIVSTTGGTEGIVREVGREAARLDMTGIYRTAFKLLSPQSLFSLSSRLFSTYYDTGTVVVVESRKGYAHAKWTNCLGFDRNLWVDVIAAAEMYLELAGATHVRMRVVSGAGPTDNAAEVQAHWT